MLFVTLLFMVQWILFTFEILFLFDTARLFRFWRQLFSRIHFPLKPWLVLDHVRKGRFGRFNLRSVIRIFYDNPIFSEGFVRLGCTLIKLRLQVGHLRLKGLDALCQLRNELHILTRMAAQAVLVGHSRTCCIFMSW